MRLIDKADDVVRAEARTFDPRELLVRPVGVLLGVSTEAMAALRPLGIHTVFDLASSSLFDSARDLAGTLSGTPSSLAEHGQVPGDVIDDSGRGNDPETLALRTIDVLRSVGPGTRKELEDALHITNVRDLGLWPPYRAARFILAAAYGDVDNETGIDPEAPPDLIPVNGRYPTERVQYATLVLETLVGDQADAVSLNLVRQVDVTSLTTEAEGYLVPAIGALLTYQQSWYAKGLTLGNLIHSVALGPGESTKIAMVDWSRRTRTGTTEDIEENEVLQEDLGRTRALTEITSAVAKETQSGRSAAQTLASAWERGTADASASTGVTWDSGPHPGVRTHGESTGESGNQGFATTWSTTSGERDVAAKLQQDIADRTQQAAHSTRTRRASIVREASQQESETLTTRTLTNYNHMHALTVQYYEVVQQFRTVVELLSAERVLFVPLQLLNFTNDQVIDRYRGILATSALTSSAREMLTFPGGTTRLRSPLISGPGLFTRAPQSAPPPPPSGSGAQPPPAPPASASGSGAQPPPGLPSKPSDAFSPDRWTASDIREARDATAGLARVLDDGRLVLPSDAVLWEVDFLADEQSVKPIDLRFEGVEGTDTAVRYGQRGWDISGNRPRLSELASVRITASGVTGTGKVAFVSCIITFRSRSFRVVFPVRLVPDQSLPVFSASTVGHELSSHLMQNRLYYSQAVWNSIDSATLGMLLSRFTVPAKGQETPLVEVVDPIPVGLVGNLLGFRAPGLDDDRDLDKTYRRPSREDHIPVPSGGVFAEAVLGRFNSAERLDVTRFWDWADSPIPVQAPDIAPLQSGSRKADDDLVPGQLSSPVLNIVNPPGLPDPSGMAGVLAAIQNGMMFRDMSGLAGTIGLAQAGVAAAQQGAQHAAEQAGLNAAVAAELGAKVAEIVGKLIAAWTTGGAGAATGALADGGSNGGIINAAKGMSKAGSLLNYARGMDQRGVPVAEPRTGASSNGTGGGGSNGADGGGAGVTTTSGGGSKEAETFDRTVTSGIVTGGSGSIVGSMRDLVLAATPKKVAVKVEFKGVFQCRLATNPDPGDHPRGANGWTFAHSGEPDLDRIVRFNNPVAPRECAATVGVTVSRVVVDGKVAADPILGELVNLGPQTYFDEAAGSAGREPLVNFGFRIGSATPLLRGASAVAPVGRGVELADPATLTALGVDTPANYLLRMDQRRSCLLAAAAKATGTKKAALLERVAKLNAFLPPVDIRMNALQFVVKYVGLLDTGLVLAAAKSPALKTVTDAPLSALRYEMRFSAFDADGLVGRVEGFIGTP